jgi:hypothetical protein
MELIAPSSGRGSLRRLRYCNAFGLFLRCYKECKMLIKSLKIKNCRKLNVTFSHRFLYSFEIVALIRLIRCVLFGDRIT